MTQVLSKQIDVGWTSPPLGIQQIDDKRIRLIAKGSELPGMDNQTIRVITTNANTLKNRAADIDAFLKAYAETVEYLYTDPKALDVYAEIGKTTPAIAKRVRDEFVPKKFLLPERADGIEAGMKEAIEFKYLPAALTAEQLKDLVQIKGR
jgi:NitT/TauT family transport system substrate-binding protein